MKILSVLLIFGCFYITSCTKDKATPNKIVQSTPVYADPPDFPISVGNTWTYKVVTNAGDVDSLIVTVIRKIVQQSGDSLYVIVKKSAFLGVDTLYASVIPGWVSYYKDIGLQTIESKYKIPLTTGDIWSDLVYASDTTQMDGIAEHIGFYGVGYDSIFALHRYAAQGTYRLREVVAVKSGIGVVYEDRSEYISYSWQYSLYLIHYYIQP